MRRKSLFLLGFEAQNACGENGGNLVYAPFVGNMFSIMFHAVRILRGAVTNNPAHVGKRPHIYERV